MKKNKVLITGGAGFIGSHLSEKLVLDDFDVTVIDNLYTGSIANIDHLNDAQTFKFINKDVTDKIENDQYDFIYNLACPASPIHYQSNPVQTVKTSILGIINVLEYAVLNKCKILQASTSEIYGDPEVHPQNENYWGSVNPIGIRSCYDESKRCSETLCFDYIRQYQIDAKVIRIFNTYGPNMHPQDGRVVSNFIVQALSGKPITIYGDGKQTRSFCYVDDLVDAIILTMSKEKGFNGPINLGNENEFTIFELAELVVDITKSKSKIVFEDLPSDDPKRRCPDTTLAKRELNWSPKVSLKDGLIKTINYFDNIIQ